MNAMNNVNQHDGLSLTGDQQNALDRLQSFVGHSKEKCFLLEGYAGTGKTFLIRRFAQWMESQNRTSLLVAPTGRAGKVLANKTGYPAGTIHRSIYAMDKLLVRRDGTDGFKFYYGLKRVAPENRPAVIVVDEASMVSDRADDEKFFGFGSGRLLKDLLSFAAANDDWAGCQVVFVGDPAQLPPVGMDVSPALDAGYLRREFGLETEGAVLRDVVRQSLDSAILKTAARIRDDIAAGRENRLVVEPCGKEIQPIDASGLCDLWEQMLKKGVGANGVPPMVCITASNRMAFAINASVRARLHPGTDGLHPVRSGDYLMIVANNRKTGLWNGELAMAIDAAGHRETRAIRCRTRDGVQTVDVVFRDVRLAVPNEEDSEKEPRVIQAKILENALYGKTRDIGDAEQIALYVDFKNRHPALREGSEEFALALSADPYFHALRVKFGYAVTCHKAQGGEWPAAAVYFESAATHVSHLRWAYTAITRAKETLFGVNLPRVGILSWQPTTASAEGAPSIEAYAEPAASETDRGYAIEREAFRRMGFPEELEWMRGFHSAFATELQKEGIEVEKVESHVGKWFVRYQLYGGGNRAWLQMAFNKKRKLTLVDVKMLTLPPDEELPKQCRACFCRAQENDIPAGTHAEALPSELRELREEHLAPVAERHGGRLLRVESLPYRERAVLKAPGDGLAVLDFCYDGRMRFGNRPEIHPQTTDRAFAECMIKEMQP
jgi:hypothetical protein